MQHLKIVFRPFLKKKECTYVGKKTEKKQAHKTTANKL